MFFKNFEVIKKFQQIEQIWKLQKNLKKFFDFKKWFGNIKKMKKNFFKNIKIKKFLKK